MIWVSASAFDILWSDLGCSGSPAPLVVRSVGRTDHERARIREEVYANLAERGLVRGGELDPELRERLDLLARASLTVECEALADLSDPEPVRAVAAVVGDRGVLAVQPRRTVALTAIHAGEAFGAVVGVLPDFDAGPGMGVNLPASALTTVADAATEHSNTRRARVFEQQAREALAIQSRPVLAAGQFSIRVRRGTKLHRMGGVSWFVTDEGGYLGAVAEGRAGEQWLSLVPTDPPRLAARLADLAHEAELDAVPRGGLGSG